MIKRFFQILLFMQIGLLLFMAVSCEINGSPIDRDPKVDSANESTASDFIERVERDMSEAELYVHHAAWLAATYINTDSQFLESKAIKEYTLKWVEYAKHVNEWDGVPLSNALRRKLNLLRSGLVLPSPNDEALARELSDIGSQLQAMYGEGRYCRSQDECFDLIEMSNILASSEDPELMKEMWQGWRSISPAMRSMYQRQVEIANAGAQDLGFSNLSEMWRSKYDMSANEFSADVDRQWSKVKPFYDALHCHVRAKLNARYGDSVVPKNGMIPAHLLGNMWAQTWGNIYELVKPDSSELPYDLTDLIVSKGWSEVEMVKVGEQFFSSLGFAPLPETFWQRSLFTKPEDRDVVCHASAWDVDGQDDLRIKMCIQKNAEDFYTIHHELGHNYYQRAYKHQPYLFRNSANDGFHEALGDTISLSVTPSYLNQIGLLDELPPHSSDLGYLMEMALDKIAFLPFGLLVDQWRWQVFSGEITPENYNLSWWHLREKYQGVTAPVPRSEEDFDPGAKYHIPANVPYTRYFLAFIQQFQFHRALCEVAGFKGPLHRCSIYGNKEAGKKLQNMMAMGVSRPWQDAMEALTGQRKLDASAIIDYFAPLKIWLDEQNQGRECGW